MNLVGDSYAFVSFSGQNKSISLPYFTVQLEYIINGVSPSHTLNISVNCETLYKCTSANYDLEGNQRTPKKGYKSITVKSEVYDYFFKEWLKVKEEYAIKRGIHSFSAYVTYQLSQLINEDKKHNGNRKSP